MNTPSLSALPLILSIAFISPALHAADYQSGCSQWMVWPQTYSDSDESDAGKYYTYTYTATNDSCSSTANSNNDTLVFTIASTDNDFPYLGVGVSLDEASMVETTTNPNLLNLLFGDAEGDLHLNLARIPIGSSDLVPTSDPNQAYSQIQSIDDNNAVTYEDINGDTINDSNSPLLTYESNKLNAMQAIRKLNPNIGFIGAVWSIPAEYKTKKTLLGKSDNQSVYAETNTDTGMINDNIANWYRDDVITLYQNMGVPFYAISTGNEPGAVSEKSPGIDSSNDESDITGEQVTATNSAYYLTTLAPTLANIESSKTLIWGLDFNYTQFYQPGFRKGLADYSTSLESVAFHRYNFKLSDDPHNKYTVDEIRNVSNEPNAINIGATLKKFSVNSQLTESHWGIPINGVSNYMQDALEILWSFHLGNSSYIDWFTIDNPDHQQIGPNWPDKGGWKGAIWTGYTDEEGNPDPWLSFPAYTLGAFAKGAVSGTPTIGEEPLKVDVSPHILYATPTTSSSKSEALINNFCEYTQTSDGEHQAGDPCAIDSDTSADDWTFNWESYTGGQVFQITIKNPAGQNAYEYNTVLLNASSQDLEVNLKEQDSGTGPTVNLNAHSVSSVQWTPQD